MPGNTAIQRMLVIGLGSVQNCSQTATWLQGRPRPQSAGDSLILAGSGIVIRGQFVSSSVSQMNKQI